jgi:hypothetical protein
MSKTSILGVFTESVEHCKYSGKTARIIGNHPHKGKIAECIGIKKTHLVDTYLFEYNIPWVGLRQFCVFDENQIEWL